MNSSVSSVFSVAEHSHFEAKFRAFAELAAVVARDPARGYYTITDGAGITRRMRKPDRIRMERLGRELGLREGEMSKD